MSSDLAAFITMYYNCNKFPKFLSFISNFDKIGIDFMMLGSKPLF